MEDVYKLCPVCGSGTKELKDGWILCKDNGHVQHKDSPLFEIKILKSRLSASEEKVKVLREAIKAIPIIDADKEINAIRDKALAATEDK